ncbi:MAG: AsmA family protein [Gammaproteobacteria bacterium]|nr:MAG: AsmA family protein [Gammaproteobacteria bacterium]
MSPRPLTHSQGSAMKTLLKLLSGLIALVIIVPVIAIIVITQVIDPNDYKSEIQALAAKHTRGQLTLEGDLGWSFFPTLGFTSGALQFRLPEDKQAPFAKLQSATVGVQLMPLFRGAVAADTIAIDGLQLNLAVDKQGNGNWTRISRETAPANDKGSSQASTAGEASGAALAVAINRVLVNNSAFNYRDADGSSQSLAINALAINDVNLAGDPLHITLDASVQSPATGNQVVPVKLDSRITLDMKQGSVRLSELKANLANLAAKGDIQLHTTSPLEISGTLDIPAFDAQALMKAVGQTVPAFQDPDVLRKVAMNITFSGPPNSVIMNPLTLVLDDTTFKGQLGISNLDTKHLLVELKGDTLNADRYQTVSDAAATADKGNTAAANQADANAALLPLATLREQRFALKLSLDKLVTNKLTLNNADVAAHGADGVIILDHLTANLYEGKLKTTASIDARTDTPLISAKQTLSDVRIGKLLTDMQGTTPFSGLTTMELDIKTRGNTMPAIKRNLSGPMTILVREGTLHGVSLERYTCQAIAATRKQQAAAQWPNDSSIERVSMSLLFKDGVGVTNDIKGKLQQIRMIGEGAVELPTDKFDMRMGIALTGDLSGTDANCTVNEAYRDIAWPVRCQGTYAGEAAKTSCGLDSKRMGEIIEKIARKEAGRALDKKAEEKLGDDWKAIKGLFGQ